MKRLAASFMIAGRDRGLADDDSRAIVARSVEKYRTTMAELAETSTLETWYAHLSAERMKEVFKAQGKKKSAKGVTKAAKKARKRDTLQAFMKLTEEVDGGYRIRSAHPVLIPVREMRQYYGFDRNALGDLETEIHRSFDEYRSTLRPDRQLLLRRFRPVDFAVKVVGVGSVGTRCFIVLLEGKDETDPLFLQVKQATQSVLEEHLRKTRYRNHGRRVVEGQRLMQAASDVFLGWSKSGQGHHYYWRQLRDWKGSADVGSFGRKRLANYAALCGWTLARSHARSGDALSIAGYLGSGTVFDEALAEFAHRYAGQNESDWSQFVEAVRDGTLEADKSG